MCIKLKYMTTAQRLEGEKQNTVLILHVKQNGIIGE